MEKENVNKDVVTVSKKLTLQVVTYVLVFVVGGVGGYFLANHSALKLPGKEQNVTNGRNFGMMGQFGSDTGTRQGFSRMGGRYSGTVTAILGNTVTIKNTSGETQTFTLGESTAYKKNTTVTKDSLVVGSTVTAGNEPGSTSSSSSTVSEVTITN